MTDVHVAQVEHVVGGMRGLKAMLWEASVLDPNEVAHPSASPVTWSHQWM